MVTDGTVGDNELQDAQRGLISWAPLLDSGSGDLLLVVAAEAPTGEDADVP